MCKSFFSVDQMPFVVKTDIIWARNQNRFDVIMPCIYIRFENIRWPCTFIWARWRSVHYKLPASHHRFGGIGQRNHPFIGVLVHAILIAVGPGIPNRRKTNGQNPSYRSAPFVFAVGLQSNRQDIPHYTVPFEVGIERCWSWTNLFENYGQFTGAQRFSMPSWAHCRKRWIRIIWWAVTCCRLPCKSSSIRPARPTWAARPAKTRNAPRTRTHCGAWRRMSVAIGSCPSRWSCTNTNTHSRHSVCKLAI